LSISFVQHNFNIVGSGSTVATTLTGVNSSNFLVAGINWTGIGTLISVSDGTNTYTPISGAGGNNGLGGSSNQLNGAVLVLPSGSAASITVTATFSASQNFPALDLTEWSGVALVGYTRDAGIGFTTNSSAANPSATSAGSSTLANDLVYGIVGSSVNVVVGASYTSVFNSGGNSTEYALAASPGSQTVNWTSAAGVWFVSMVSFVPAGATFRPEEDYWVAPPPSPPDNIISTF
jgi:hypothetical protein